MATDKTKGLPHVAAATDAEIAAAAIAPFVQKRVASLTRSREACEAEVFDAILDGIWVLVGLGLAMGLPLNAGWLEVRRSNLEKIMPTGQVRRRADGKILKPDNWTPPLLAEVLGLHRAAENSNTDLRKELHSLAIEPSGAL